MGVLNSMRNRFDGALVNLLTGLGTSADPRKSTGIQAPQRLSQADVEWLVEGHWEAHKYVTELPNEALRKWITLTMEGGPADAAKQVLDLLEEKEARQKLRQALEWERQYGGAGLLLGVADAEDASQPLNLDGDGVEGALRFMEPYSRYRIQDPSTSPLVKDADDPRFGLPEIYYVRTEGTGAYVPVHHSRIIIFQGWSPRERINRYDWGVTMLDRFWPPLRDYESALGYGLGIGARLVETKLKLKGFLAAFTGNAELKQAMRDRLQETATARSVFKILPMDSEDEIVDSQIQFTGYAEMIRIARENLAAASGLSLQRFFGTARAGLGDSDESGSERDDASVAAFQRDRLMQPINRLVEVAVASKGLRKKVRTWQVQFIPLREETPSSRADRQLKQAQTGQIYRETGAVHEDEIREGLRADPDAPYQLEDGSVAEAFGPSDEEIAELAGMRAEAESTRPFGGEVSEDPSREQGGSTEEDERRSVP